MVAHSDVVGASPVGAAPTTSLFWTQHLASMDWAKITARRDQTHLDFGWDAPYILDLTVYQILLMASVRCAVNQNKQRITRRMCANVNGPQAYHNTYTVVVLQYPAKHPLKARFMGPTWGPSGADRTQVGTMLAPWTLLSESLSGFYKWHVCIPVLD